MLYIKLAWRNLIKNSRRTLITSAGVGIVLALMLSFQALIDGSNRQFLDFTLSSGLGHLEIHRAGFTDDPSVDLLMTDTAPLSALGSDPDVKALALRLETGGLVSSGETSRGAMLVGVQPASEAGMSIVEESVTEGEYLGPEEGYVVMGSDLARSLLVGVGDKVVLMTMAADGSMGAGAYRVKGLFNTGTPIDRGVVYLTLPDAHDLLATDGVSTLALRLSDLSTLDDIAEEFRGSLGEDYEVLTWRQAQPGLYFLIELREALGFIISLFSYLIASFGVLNTFLMSVMERVREFGLLMSLGTKPRQIVASLYAEAVMLSLLASAAGTVLSAPLLWLIIVRGVSMPGIEQITEQMNIAIPTTLYGQLVPQHAIVIYLMLLGVSLLAMLYPAIKVFRLKPVEALRHI